MKKKKKIAGGFGKKSVLFDHHFRFGGVASPRTLRMSSGLGSSLKKGSPTTLNAQMTGKPQILASLLLFLLYFFLENSPFRDTSSNMFWTVSTLTFFLRLLSFFFVVEKLNRKMWLIRNTSGHRNCCIQVKGITKTNGRE